MATLVYVDPSPRGEWALTMAALLPPEWRSSLLLLATAEDVQAHPELLGHARARLGAAGSIGESVLPGPAERAVVAATQARSYDLLVVPPAGRGAVTRMLKGSRVATVVRSVRAPVLVARRPPVRLERILAAVSGGRSTAAVIGMAKKLAEGLAVEPFFLHVASEVALPSPPESHRGEGTPVDAVRARLAQAGVPAGHLLVRDGLVMDEVLEEFERGAHHLLLLGAPAEEAGGSWGREEVTERILLRCPGSALIVPRA